MDRYLLKETGMFREREIKGEKGIEGLYKK